MSVSSRAPRAQCSERGNPPQQRQIGLIPRSQATGLKTAAIGATAGTVGVFVLDSELGVFSGGTKGTVATVAVVFINLLAAILAFWVARVWRRSSSGGSPGEDLGVVRGNLLPAIIALACLLLPYIVLPIEAFVAWRQIWREGDASVPDPREVVRAEADHRREVFAWQQRIADFDANETPGSRRRTCGIPCRSRRPRA